MNPVPAAAEPPTPVLHRYAAGVLEGGWLAALALPPLVFDVFANQVFEPVKAYTLRLIALLMLGAWIMMAFEAWVLRRQGHRSAFPFTMPPHGTGRAVVWLAVLGWCWYGVSTLFSVHPTWSLWGSDERMQGLFTVSAYLILFLSVVGMLRTRAQWERIVTTALVTSFVVALYALTQYFQGDPLTWDSPWEQARYRVASTLGNPIFAGGYLILILPLTLYRLFPLLRTSSRSTRGGLGLLLILLLGAWALHPLAGSGLAVGAWSLARWQTGRSDNATPWVPLTAYLTLGSLQTVALVHTQGRGALLGLLAGLFLFGLLYALVRGRQWVARGWLLAGLVALGGLLWVGTRAPTMPLQDPGLIERLTEGVEARSVKTRLLIWEGAVDLLRAHPGRLWTGHGPQTLSLVYGPYDRPARSQFEGHGGLIDNLHNATLHVLITQGWPGSLIYLAGFALLFYLVLTSLGLMAGPRNTMLYTLLILGGALLLPLVAGVLGRGWTWTVPLVGVGLAGGVLAFLALKSLKSKVGGETAWTYGLPGVALGALLMAHFVEAQAGLQIVATQVHFWIFAGAVVVYPRLAAPASAAPVPATSHVLPLHPWLLVIILITLYHLFDPLSLTERGPLMVLWVLCFTLLFIWMLAPAQAGLGRALLVGAGYVGIHYLAYQTFRFDVVRTVPFALAVVGLLLGFGWPGFKGQLAAPPQAFRRGGWAVLLALVGAIGLGVWYLALQPAQADLLFAQARRLEDRGRFDESLSAYRAAVAKAPVRDQYPGYLAGALGLQAFKTPNPSAREALFLLAVATNQTAWTQNPRNGDHPIKRARLYRNWARVTADSLTRQAHFREADQHYAAALRLRPAQASLWTERGNALAEAGALEAARTQYTHALDLVPRYEGAHLALGRLYGRQGKWETAVDVYRNALRLRARSAPLFHGLAAAYTALGDSAQAVKAYQASTIQHPKDLVAHRALMHWYADQGACPDARVHARQVLAAQPQNRTLQNEVRRIYQQCSSLDTDPSP